VAVEEKIQQQFRITATGILPRGCQTTTRISHALFRLPSLFPDVVTKKHRPQGYNYLKPADSYGYDTLSAIAPYEYRPRVSTNKALRRIFEMKPGEISERINNTGNFSMP
jgi:hypothetical protein